jgi:acyl-CoA synthetase (AMP-forming)/AMP-acid ligase II/thioesterase domain-containing protein
VPLSANCHEEELMFFVKEARPKVFVTSSDSDDVGRKTAQRLGITTLELRPSRSLPGFLTFGDDYLTADNERKRPPPRPESAALLLHTSGTTARPKLVKLSHKNLIHAARNVGATLDLNAADRCLNVMPLFHAHGIVGGLLAPLAAGGASICPPAFAAEKFFPWLRAYRPTWYTAVPTIHRAIVRASSEDANALQCSCIRLVRSCSAALDAQLFSDLQQTFKVPVVEAYGMTEAAHQISSNPVGTGMQKPGTVGLPTGTEIAILDPGGELLPNGDVGEVAVRGVSIFGAYENDIDANASSFVKGWFRTGDQGRIDIDGYLILTGRLKDQVNRGGEKISPLEIDQALLAHADVLEAVAFGFPHPTLGEDIGAAVVLRDDCEKRVGPAELRSYLSKRVAQFKIPRRIFVLKEIPKSPIGKIQRQRLSQILCAKDATLLSAIDDTTALPETETKLIELWQRFFPGEHFGCEDDFFALGGDSLSATEMLLEAAHLFKIRLDPSICPDPLDVRSLARTIDEAAPSEWSPILKLQIGAGQSDHPPLLFFHGDRTGGGLYARRLARLLGKEHGLVSIAPHVAWHEDIPASIEAMAAERLPLLLDFQHEGPFRVGGACVGGLIALEAARLLLELGHVVDFVAMVDSPLFNARPLARTFTESVGGVLQKSSRRLQHSVDVAWLISSKAETLLRTPLSSWPARVLFSLERRIFGRGGNVNDEARERDTSDGWNDGSSEIAKSATEAAYLRAMRRFFPDPIAVPIVFYSAEYSSKPLRHISRQTKSIEVPGGHLGCISTHLEVLASHLSSEMQRPAGGGPCASSFGGFHRSSHVS